MAQEYRSLIDGDESDDEVPSKSMAVSSTTQDEIPLPAPTKRKSILETHDIAELRPLSELLEIKGATDIKIKFRFSAAATIKLTLRGQRYRIDVYNNVTRLWRDDWSIAEATTQLDDGGINLAHVKVEANSRGMGFCSIIVITAVYSVIVFEHASGPMFPTKLTVSVATNYPQAATKCYIDAGRLIGFQTIQTEKRNRNESMREYQAELAEHIAAGYDIDTFGVYTEQLTFSNPPWASESSITEAPSVFDTTVLNGVRPLRELLGNLGVSDVVFRSASPTSTDATITLKGKTYDVSLTSYGARIEKLDSFFDTALCNIVFTKYGVEESKIAISRVYIDESERGRGLCQVIVVCGVYSALMNLFRAGKKLPSVLGVHILSYYPIAARRCYTVAAELIGFSGRQIVVKSKPPYTAEYVQEKFAEYVRDGGDETSADTADRRRYDEYITFTVAPWAK